MVQARDRQGLVLAVQGLDHQAQARMVQARDRQGLVLAVQGLDHQAQARMVQAVQDPDHQALRRRSQVRPFLLTLRLSREFRPWATGSKNTILEPTAPQRAPWR